MTGMLQGGSVLAVGGPLTPEPQYFTFLSVSLIMASSQPPPSTLLRAQGQVSLPVGRGVSSAFGSE